MRLKITIRFIIFFLFLFLFLNNRKVERTNNITRKNVSGLSSNHIDLIYLTGVVL